MKTLEERENKMLETMRNADVKEGKRRMENKYMLDAL
jgi:hypothetical protein